MHDVFEIGFREGLSIETIVDFLAGYFGLDRKCIVSEGEYWSNIWEGNERLGIGIQTAIDGLKTNLSGVSYRSLDDVALENLAKAAARSLDSEAVIGDYRKHGLDARGRFLSYFPDGSVWEAVDSSHGSVSDVKVLRRA
jgi:hypothetical protein